MWGPCVPERAACAHMSVGVCVCVRFSCPYPSHSSPLPYSCGGLDKGGHDACPASLTGNLQTNAHEGRVTNGTNAQVKVMIFLSHGWEEVYRCWSQVLAANFPCSSGADLSSLMESHLTSSCEFQTSQLWGAQTRHRFPSHWYS